MKIKNITNSNRYCWNRRTGEKLTIAPYKILEIDKVLFDKRSFKIINDRIDKNEKSEKKSTGINRETIKRRNKI